MEQVTLTGKETRVLTKKEQVEQKKDFVEDMVYRISAPTICWPGYEEEVSLEMVEEARKTRLLKKPDNECTDYDAALYLSQASMVAPLDRTMAKIYMDVFTRAFPDKAKTLWGEVGDPEPLEEWELHELHRFKQWIYKKQIKILKSKEKRDPDEPAPIKLESFIKA